MSDVLDIFSSDPEVPADWRDMIDTSAPNAALADACVELVREEVGELSELEALRLWAVVAYSPVESSADTVALLEYAWLVIPPGEPPRLRWGWPPAQLMPHAEHVAYFQALARLNLHAS